MERSAIYRTIWRWHFYAGLFVMPFIAVLAVSGALYLFKPQIDHWEERGFRNLPAAVANPDVQVDAALAANSDAQFVSYRLAAASTDAAQIIIRLPGGGKREVFVAPSGQIVGSIDPDTRIIAFDRKVHGQLLLGKKGAWLIELAASWAIVMILTGLYLWWPRGRGLAGVVWPRLRGKSFWRDLHAVTGFWVSSLALVLLLSGLPWAAVWGDAFKMVRAEMGWTRGHQDWTIGGEHDHGAMLAMQAQHLPPFRLSQMVAKTVYLNLAPPVLVEPPGDKMVWTVKSDAQNRPLRQSYAYDMMTGRQLSHERFADKHVIDRVIGTMVAWHEGQLFGWINQMIGVLTAAALLTLMVSGFILWRRRKPEAGLGAPPLPSVPIRMRGVAVILLVAAALLPMLAASLILLALFDRLLLPRLAGLATWLGVADTKHSQF